MRTSGLPEKREASRGRRRVWPVLAGLACVLLAAPGAAAVDASSPPVVSLTGLRSWSAPTSTRIVFDFSAEVAAVAPDSGVTHALTVAVPAQVARAQGVPAVLGVRDGVVDSVRVTTGEGGTRLEFIFADTTRFRVFSLRAEDGKPFRLVVDVMRPGGHAEEDRRLASIAASKKQERVRVVAVDAGHGGEDSGARGLRGVLEKRVNLGVARAMVEALNRIPGIQAALTRDGDYFIPLRERYRIAERMKADLFISVHANSSRRRGSGSGAEVFFLSLRGASDQAAQDLADLENAADHVGGVPSRAEDDLVNILYDVKRASALQQSQLLAETLLGQLAGRLGERGVKQAGFAVLKSVEFPSVLVETAFINNQREVRLLRDPEFQRKIGKQLAEGVRAYFERAGVGLAVPAGAARSAQVQDPEGGR